MRWRPAWFREVRARRALDSAIAIEEAVAAGVPFAERGVHLRRAVDQYLDAARHAATGSQIWLEAVYRAGSLLAAEDSVRDPARAIPLLESVVERVEGFHDAYYFLGEAHALLQEFDAAERAWRIGLRLNPRHVGIGDVLKRLPIDRAHHALSSGDNGAIIAALESTPPDERSGEAWLLLGDAYAALGESDHAAQAWRSALRREPMKGLRRRFRSIGIPFPEGEAGSVDSEA